MPTDPRAYSYENMDGPGDLYKFDEKYLVFTFYVFYRIFPGLCCYYYAGYWNYGVSHLPCRGLNYMSNEGYWNNDDGISRDVYCLP